MQPIKLEYSEPLIRRTIKLFLWRQVGPFFLIVTAAMMAPLIYLLLKEERSWRVGLIGAVTFMAVSVMTVSYFVHLKRLLTKLRSMGRPEGTLELEDTYFRISSDVGNFDVHWPLIKQLWRLDEVWLIFFSSGEFMTLPIKNFSEDNKQFMLSKFQQAGAKVV